MDLNSSIKVLIDSALKAQEKGVFTWYESRDIANSVDAIENISKQHKEVVSKQEGVVNKQEEVDIKTNEQSAIPPIARLSSN